MKFILPLALFFLTISSSLSAATYVTTSGVTQNILTTSGEAHPYAGTNLAPSTSLYYAALRDADLRNADLTEADLYFSVLDGVDFTNADLTNADLSNSDLNFANLTGVDLTGAILMGTDLYAVVSGNTIGNPLLPESYQMVSGYIVGPRVNLTGAVLTGIDLTELDLRDAHLINANLRNADLRFTVLSNARLTGADLTNADLSNVYLNDVRSGNIVGTPILRGEYTMRNGYIIGPGVDLTNGDLSGADLSDIDLSGADLTNADLTGADLTNANLLGASLTGADLTGVDLTGVRTSSGALDVLLDNLRNKISLLEARIAQAVTGPRGEKGDKGDKGDTGDTGPRGPAGLDSTAIQTLKVSEPYVEVNKDGSFNVQYTVQSSDDLSTWTDEEIIDATITPESTDKQFLRIGVD